MYTCIWKWSSGLCSRRCTAAVRTHHYRSSGFISHPDLAWKNKPKIWICQSVKDMQTLDALQQYVRTTIDHHPPHPQTLTVPKWFKQQYTMAVLKPAYLQTCSCRPWHSLRFRLASIFASLPLSCTQSTYIALTVYITYSTQQPLYTTAFCYCV